MDHHLAETRSVMLRESYNKGYVQGGKDILAYMRLSDERHIKELEEGNPFKWLGDFLKKKFSRKSSPETVIPNPSEDS